MRKLTVSTIGIAALCITCIVGARVSGVTKNEPGTFAELVHQSSNVVGGVWCWLDICPGHTTMAEARTRILQSSMKLIPASSLDLEVETDDGSSMLEINATGDGKSVNTIAIAPGQKMMTLAESVLQYGAPISITRDALIWYQGWRRYICFKSQSCVYIEGFGSRMEMQFKVLNVIYYSAEDANGDAGRPWRGFGAIRSN